jgi:Domain of unknown function (DUF397)
VIVEWTKSTFCADKACVEVALVSRDIIAVRDGKNVHQPHLRFSREEWTSFLDGVASGDFELR